MAALRDMCVETKEAVKQFQGKISPKKCFIFINLFSGRLSCSNGCPAAYKVQQSSSWRGKKNTLWSQEWFSRFVNRNQRDVWFCGSLTLRKQIRLGTVQTGRHLRLSHLFYSTFSAKKNIRMEPIAVQAGFSSCKESRSMTQAVSLESSDWRMIASHLAFERLPQLEKSLNSQDWEQHHMDPQNAPEVTAAWLGKTSSAHSVWGGDLVPEQWSYEATTTTLLQHSGGQKTFGDWWIT